MAAEQKQNLQGEAWKSLLPPKGMYINNDRVSEKAPPVKCYLQLLSDFNLIHEPTFHLFTSLKFSMN